MRTLVLFLACFALSCAKYAVRNSVTYAAEVEWNVLAMKEASVLLAEAAEEHRSAGDIEGCLRFAETSLLLSTRGSWHGAMALHLADLASDPGDAPEVPKPDTLCAEGS